MMTNWRAWYTLSGITWHWVSLSYFASFHTMWSHKWIPIFQRSILPPSARSRCLEWGCFPHAQHRSCPPKYWRKWWWLSPRTWQSHPPVISKSGSLFITEPSPAVLSAQTPCHQITDRRRIYLGENKTRSTPRINFGTHSLPHLY